MLKEIEQIIIDCQLKGIEPVIMALKIIEFINDKNKTSLKGMQTCDILDELKRRCNVNYPKIIRASKRLHQNIEEYNNVINSINNNSFASKIIVNLCPPKVE